MCTSNFRCTCYGDLHVAAFPRCLIFAPDHRDALLGHVVHCKCKAAGSTRNLRRAQAVLRPHFIPLFELVRHSACQGSPSFPSTLFVLCNWCATSNLSCPDKDPVGVRCSSLERTSRSTQRDFGRQCRRNCKMCFRSSTKQPPARSSLCESLLMCCSGSLAYALLH